MPTSSGLLATFRPGVLGIRISRSTLGGWVRGVLQSERWAQLRESAAAWGAAASGAREFRNLGLAAKREPSGSDRCLHPFHRNAAACLDSQPRGDSDVVELAGIRIGAVGRIGEGGVESVNPSEIFSGNGSTTDSFKERKVLSSTGVLYSEDQFWTPSEPDEVIAEFTKLLRGPTGDGASKRKAGEKVSWKVDPGHIQAAFRHLGRWADGITHDAESGAPHLAHAAWRLLAQAFQEEQDFIKEAN